MCVCVLNSLNVCVHAPTPKTTLFVRVERVFYTTREFMYIEFSCVCVFVFKLPQHVCVCVEGSSLNACSSAPHRWQQPAIAQRMEVNLAAVWSPTHLKQATGHREQAVDHLQDLMGVGQEGQPTEGKGHQHCHSNFHQQEQPREQQKKRVQ